MNFALKTIIVIVVAFLAMVAWACCMVAHTADEDAERMYQDYLKWKRRKEQKGNDTN